MLFLYTFPDALPDAFHDAFPKNLPHIFACKVASQVVLIEIGSVGGKDPPRE